jgi:hypothetical protein
MLALRIMPDVENHGTEASTAPANGTNQAESLGLEFDDRGINGDSNSILFGDMGSSYIFLDRDGSITSSFECY